MLIFTRKIFVDCLLFYMKHYIWYPTIQKKLCSLTTIKFGFNNDIWTVADNETYEN